MLLHWTTLLYTQTGTRHAALAMPHTFKTDAEAYLAEIGARPWPGGFYAYVLQTTIGELWITPHDDWIACRWGNFNKAHKAGLQVNPYTAEWNFRHLTRATLGFFRRQLRPSCCNHAKSPEVL